jgi:hypothetical protein
MARLQPHCIARIRGRRRRVLAQLPLPERRAVLRRATSYDASDRQHERLRSFRNIAGISACRSRCWSAITIALVMNPTWSLCFEAPTPASRRC